MKNSFEVCGDTATIFIDHHGEKLNIKIDLDDLPIVQAMPNLWIVKARRGAPVVESSLGGTKFRLARWLFKGTLPDDCLITFKSTDRFDYRRSNLIVRPRKNEEAKFETDSSFAYMVIRYKRTLQKIKFDLRDLEHVKSFPGRWYVSTSQKKLDVIGRDYNEGRTFLLGNWIMSNELSADEVVKHTGPTWNYCRSSLTVEVWKNTTSYQNREIEYKISEKVTALFFSSKGINYDVLIDTDKLDRFLSFNGAWKIMKEGEGKVILLGYTNSHSVILSHWLFPEFANQCRVIHDNNNFLDNRRANINSKKLRVDLTRKLILKYS